MGPPNPMAHPSARLPTLLVFLLLLGAAKGVCQEPTASARKLQLVSQASLDKAGQAQRDSPTRPSQDGAAQNAAPAVPAANSPAAAQANPPVTLPNAPGPGAISGTVTDTTGALVPNAEVILQEPASNVTVLTARSDPSGDFTLSPVPPGVYRIRIEAAGFSAWTVYDVQIHSSETFALPPVKLGVEAINTAVDAITVEDLAEQQVTAEEHQRILGILPNFYVSYVPNAQPLTPRQKFKLAFVISRDPVTFLTTGISAGIEQATGALNGYGPGFPGYAQRYAATYGDRLSSTFLGSAIFPSLFHQDPRYFYLGHGSILHRALYAISTTVICKGDNGHWQPNFSNVLGNLGSAGISNLYRPASDRHDAQDTVDNSLIGVAQGAIGTLFQEFLLRHLTERFSRKWQTHTDLATP